MMYFPNGGIVATGAAPIGLMPAREKDILIHKIGFRICTAAEA